MLCADSRLMDCRTRVQRVDDADEDPSRKEFTSFASRPIGHPSFMNALRAEVEVRARRAASLITARR